MTLSHEVEQLALEAATELERERWQTIIDRAAANLVDDRSIATERKRILFTVQKNRDEVIESILQKKEVIDFIESCKLVILEEVESMVTQMPSKDLDALYLAQWRTIVLEAKKKFRNSQIFNTIMSRTQSGMQKTLKKMIQTAVVQITWQNFLSTFFDNRIAT
jgi:predicted nucleotide-binding protein (sugar kinase/HSP70/actin superfamily)